MRITPTRLDWLKYLAQYGETSWSRMPRKRSAHRIAVSNRTWVPMREAGLIESKFYSPHYTKPVDHYFKITDLGREAMLREVNK